MTMLTKKLGILCIVLAVASPSPAISQMLPFHNYTIRDGLPSNHVTALCQDSRGFLWIGTDEGLSVYDGEAFRTYTTADGLVNAYVTAVIESKESPGTMWIASIADGLTRCKDGVFTAIRFPSDSLRTFAGNIAEDRQGTLWSVTSKGVFRLAADSLRSFPIHPPELIGGNDVVVASDGRIWFGVNHRVYIYSPLERRTGVIELDLRPNAYINRVMMDREGDIWISANDSSLRRFVGERLVATWRSGAHGIVDQLVLDRHGELWMTTFTGVLRIPKKNFPDGIPIAYTRSNGLQDNIFNPILEDREEIIWFGGWSSGLYKVPEKNVAALDLTNNILGFPDSVGHLWLLNHHGVWECKKEGNGALSAFDHQLLPEGSGMKVLFVRPDTRGRMWIQFSDSSLRCYSILNSQGGPSTLRKSWTLKSGKDFPDALLWTYYIDPRNYLWLSLGNGIGVVDLNVSPPKFLALLGKEDKILTSSVRAIYRDSKDNVWFGSFSEGLAQLAGGDLTGKHIRHFTTADGLPDNGIRSFAEDDAGKIWIGTRFGGVAIYDGASFHTISIQQGLLSNAVWTMAKDESHHMWLGTGAGMMSISTDNLTELRTSDVMTRERWTVYYSAGTKTVWMVRSGEVIAMGEENTARNAPPVHISKVTINDKSTGIRNGMEFPHDKNNIVIEFIGVSFRGEKSVRYEYRLQGIDSGWSNPTRQRAVTYAALSPGTYTFETIALNSDGIWSSTPASFSFTILPPIWQRWWFRSIGALLFLTVGPFVYYVRVSKLEREKEMQQEFSRRLIESQESERKRIAAELHDSLGQNLLVIQNQALLALDAHPEKPEIQDRLNDISIVTTQTIQEVREIAHNLRPYHLDKLGLTTSINSIIRRISESSKITFTSDVDLIDGLFSKEEDSHIYRIIQEAINNIIRHSQATEASVSVKQHQGKITVRIRDNGRGFAQARNALPTTEESTHGFGLIGLGERVRILNGSLSFGSSPGRGTTLFIDIPCRGNNNA
jgi:signal transduction histidine kinase/ligand-binding sensor domain-containing protein